MKARVNLLRINKMGHLKQLGEPRGNHSWTSEVELVWQFCPSFSTNKIIFTARAVNLQESTAREIFYYNSCSVRSFILQSLSRFQATFTPSSAPLSRPTFVVTLVQNDPLVLLMDRSAWLSTYRSRLLPDRLMELGRS